MLYNLRRLRERCVLSKSERSIRSPHVCSICSCFALYCFLNWLFSVRFFVLIQSFNFWFYSVILLINPSYSFITSLVSIKSFLTSSYLELNFKTCLLLWSYFPFSVDIVNCDSELILFSFLRSFCRFMIFYLSSNCVALDVAACVRRSRTSSHSSLFICSSLA